MAYSSILLCPTLPTPHYHTPTSWITTCMVGGANRVQGAWKAIHLCRENVSIGARHTEALDGDPQCHMSILRNGDYTYLHRFFFTMSHVEFKKRSLCVTILLTSMTHVSGHYFTVKFKIYQCRPVGFKGQGPSHTQKGWREGGGPRTLPQNTLQHSRIW